MRTKRAPLILAGLCLLAVGVLALVGAAEAGPTMPRARPDLALGIAQVAGTPREIALTFDDGPNPAGTPQVLEMLTTAGARATFFVLGPEARAHPRLVQETVADGMEIGCHGSEHVLLIGHSTSTIRDAFDRCAAAVKEVSGARPTLVRPPYGLIPPDAGEELQRVGYRVVFWNLRAAPHWGSPEDTARAVAGRLQPGDILLLHDSRRERQRTLEVLPHLLNEMAARGYTAVTLSHLLADGRPVTETWGEISARYCRVPFLHPPTRDCPA